MVEIQEIAVPGYEKVVEAKDASVGLHAFIAIHDTTLGPAMGGTRIFPYKNREDALNDVLRLAKAMTYKSAVAECGLGGGKSVIIGDPKKVKSEAFWSSFAEVLNVLKGVYIAAEDVGTTTEDMSSIRKSSCYVAALPTDQSSGDPSRFTARGCYQGIKAAANFLWNSENLRGKTVAIQGLGSVGSKLAQILFWEGANLIVADLDQECTHRTQILYGAQIVQPDELIFSKCDILAPCAMGGVITPEIVPQLRCKMIAGCANNQLSEERVAYDLKNREILYAVDYVINAGGIINAAAEFEPGGYDPKNARDRLNAIYDSLALIFVKAKKLDEPTTVIAGRMAEDKLANQIGKRLHPIIFKKS